MYLIQLRMNSAEKKQESKKSTEGTIAMRSSCKEMDI